MKYAIGFTLLSVVLATAGCGESHSSEEDAGITFDATRPPDTGMVEVDAGPSTEGDIGQPCGTMADCESFCITEEDGFTGGYCTAACDVDNPCPSGATCTPVGRGQSICLADCDPAAETRSCRMGYGCASSFMLPGPVCLPGCTDDTDCAEGTMCDPDGGTAGQCFDPTASFGDACTSEDQCPEDGFCLNESWAGWPGGACIGFGCDPDTGTGCADGTVCLRSARGGGICLDSCGEGDACREGYSCEADTEFTDRMFCAPGCTDDAQCSGGRVCNPGTGICDVPFEAGELGMACSGSRDACEGGTCLTEFESGMPGSYCTYVGCDPTLADGAEGADGCPGGGVCVDAGTAGICLAGCSGSEDCRTGYSCSPSDPADATSPTACRAACADDTVCANDGFECNLGTGLCREPFDDADIGEPCSAGTGCEGGQCLSEEDAGWPAGTCSFPGCRLSGDGPAETCPTGTVCIDEGEGDPTLGVCIDACTVGGTGECRPGYACVALTSGGTEGACRPACDADDDCAAGRTCNTTTGLCE